MTLVHREPAGPFEKACYLALAASLLLLGWTILRLVLPADVVVAERGGAPDVASIEDRASTPVAAALRVVASDPFHVARTAPESRYILPEEGAELVVEGREGEGNSGAVRILGTVVVGVSGGFVMAQVGAATPVTIRVGDEIGGLRLRSIRRGEGEFEALDGTPVLLSVPTAVAGPGGGGGT